MKCCFCGKEITGYGNNPDGAMKEVDGKVVDCEYTEDDRCCDECNNYYVIFGRLYKMGLYKIK